MADNDAQTIYLPIPDATRQVRLLEILDSPTSHDVYCSLNIYDIDSAPPYTAISYTWGENASAWEITINETQVSVRRNCRLALRLARFHREALSKHVWIDAICIDQKNLSEKSHQVSLMAEIYSRARFVLVSLGSKRTLGGPIGPDLVRMSLRDLKSWAKSADSHYRYGYLCNHNICRDLARLGKASYWKRVWIVQEYLLASERSLYIAAGNRLIDCAKLNHFLDAIAHTEKSHIREAISLYGMTTLCIQRHHESRRRAKPRRRDRSLPDLMRTFENQVCSELKDKVFGLLSLVVWSNREIAMPADYTISLFEIGIECLRYAVPPDVARRALAFDCNHLEINDRINSLEAIRWQAPVRSLDDRFLKQLPAWVPKTLSDSHYGVDQSSLAPSRAMSCDAYDAYDLVSSFNVTWLSEIVSKESNIPQDLCASPSKAYAALGITRIDSTWGSEISLTGTIPVAFFRNVDLDCLEIEVIWVPWRTPATLPLILASKRSGIYGLPWSEEVDHRVKYGGGLDGFANRAKRKRPANAELCGLILRGTDHQLYLLIGRATRKPTSAVQCNQWLKDTRFDKSSLFCHIAQAASYNNFKPDRLDIPIYMDPEDILVSVCQDDLLAHRARFGRHDPDVRGGVEYSQLLHTDFKRMATSSAT